MTVTIDPPRQHPAVCCINIALALRQAFCDRHNHTIAHANVGIKRRGVRGDPAVTNGEIKFWFGIGHVDSFA